MRLKRYLKIVKILISTVEYFVLGLLFKHYPNRSIDNIFYFYVFCALFGFGCGITFIGIMEFYDLQFPFEPFTFSSDEPNILSNNSNSTEILEKKLKEDQEEIKHAKKVFTYGL